MAPAGALTPRVAMVAGEASGDLLGGLLLDGLKARWPALQAAGIGGPRMAERGFEAWWPHHKLSVSGYVEVLSRYREISAIRDQFGERLLRADSASRADLFVGVDAPDFNLGLETRLRAQGIKTVHFISPSIWAWRRKRIEKIRHAADLVLCLFPFEPEIYLKEGIAAAYVGHPLADLIPLEVPRASARQKLGIPAEETVIALLPGSRRAEARYITPGLLRAAVEMTRQRPGLRFLIPVVEGVRDIVQPLCLEHAPALKLELLDGRSHEVLAACDLALVASGTATLEAALFKRPMVIVYVVHEVNWQVMRHMRYLPWIGLPNILLGELVVPEFVQRQVTTANLARAAFQWLDDPVRCEALRARFEQLHRDLRRNTARAAADAIEKIIAR